MTFPYKKALVTGGAGFIGSHLVEELEKMGVEVVSVDYRHFPGIDISTNSKELGESFKGVDIVFHNACSRKYEGSVDPVRDLDVNIKGTLNLLILAKKYGVKKFIHTSSGSVYGEPLYSPQDENHPTNPLCHYAVSKLAGERYAILYHQLHGLDVTVLRPYNVYGPRQNDDDDNGGVIAIYDRRIREGKPLVIHGDGMQTRHFTYVKDVVRANIFVATHPETKGQVYNCASPEKSTISKLVVCMLSEKEGRKYFSEPYPSEYKDLRRGDVVYSGVTSKKLMDLGFEFEYKLREGLHETMLH